MNKMEDLMAVAMVQWNQIAMEQVAAVQQILD